MTKIHGKREDLSCRCPVCDVTLAADPALPTYDTPCPDCGYHLWCCKRKVDDVIVLSVLPDRIPEHAGIKRLAESLVGSCRVLRVAVDLSGLNVIDSATIARLVVLRKLVLTAKGSLVLCGLSPHARTVFSRTRLDRLFEILETETDALNTLNSGASRRQVHATPVRTPQLPDNAAEDNRPTRDQLGTRQTANLLAGGRAVCSL